MGDVFVTISVLGALSCIFLCDDYTPSTLIIHPSVFTLAICDELPTGMNHGHTENRDPGRSSRDRTSGGGQNVCCNRRWSTSHPAALGKPLNSYLRARNLEDKDKTYTNY